MGQLALDERPRAGGRYRHPPVETLEEWQPSVGDEVVGEYHQPSGEWGLPDFGSAILLRIKPYTDLRVRVDIETWRSLNRGELAAPEALLRRGLTMEGDFLLGLKLHLILS